MLDPSTGADHESPRWGLATRRVSPPPTPPHNVADQNESVVAGPCAATLRGGGHAPTRERLPSARSIGQSYEGRPIRVEFVGDKGAQLRILIMAGQHGDEPFGRHAVEQFTQWALPAGPGAAGVCIACVANVNPDGAARNGRHNAQQIDLNRDHQLLRSPEITALHRFVRTWRPHLVIDVHTYPPRRARLLRDHLVHCHDVLVDWPNNPSLPAPWRAVRRGRPLASLVPPLARGGFRCGRYTLLTGSGRIRHSTPDVVDARNGLALRYGMRTVLLEGRQPTRHDPPAAGARLLQAFRTALRELIRWAECCADILTVPAMSLPLGTRLPVRCRYRAAVAPCRMAMQDARDGVVRNVALSGSYTPALVTTCQVTLPRAYAVPRECHQLIGVLSRHGFPQWPAAEGLVPVECYRIDRVRPSRRSGRPPRRLAVRIGSHRQWLDQHVVFPVTPRGGRALAVLLEPESKYGLSRHGELGLALKVGNDYPVLRVA